jgi:hypothetical protein
MVASFRTNDPVRDIASCGGSVPSAARQNSTRLLFVSQFCGTIRLALRVSIAKDFLGCVSKIRKAHFRRLILHILVEKPRGSTTAPAFFASICKPIQQNCIF